QFRFRVVLRRCAQAVDLPRETLELGGGLGELAAEGLQAVGVPPVDGAQHHDEEPEDLQHGRGREDLLLLPEHRLVEVDLLHQSVTVSCLSAAPTARTQRYWSAAGTGSSTSMSALRSMPRTATPSCAPRYSGTPCSGSGSGATTTLPMDGWLKWLS